MKRITFLITAILVTFQLHTSAQFISGFGIKGGVTFSNQIYDYPNTMDIDNHYIRGFSGSIFSEFIGGKFINLYAETGFEQRGFILPILRTDEFGNPIGEYGFKYRTNYIYVTLGAKLKHTSKYFTPYLLFQPRVNFYTGYTQKFPDDTPEFENSVLRDFKKIMFDAGIGTGIQFNRLLPFKVFIEGNYFPGIITSYSNGSLDVNEHSFSIKLGINFIKDKK